MNIKKYIGIFILFLVLLASSCQKQELLTDEELFNKSAVTNSDSSGDQSPTYRMSTDTSGDGTDLINDDDDDSDDEDEGGDIGDDRTSIFQGGEIRK